MLTTYAKFAEHTNREKLSVNKLYHEFQVVLHFGEVLFFLPGGSALVAEEYSGSRFPAAPRRLPEKSPARNVSGNATFFLPRDVLY